MSHDFIITVIVIIIIIIIIIIKVLYITKQSIQQINKAKENTQYYRY